MEKTAHTLRGRDTSYDDAQLPLKIIPVMDLKGGVVVMAKGGHRHAYAPIQTPLAVGADPLDVARALARRVGHRQLYVADLDALSGAPPAWHVHRRLQTAGFDLWLDAGLSWFASSISGPPAGQQVQPQIGPHFSIVSLETLPSLNLLEDLLVEVEPKRLIFSLDLVDGAPLTERDELRKLSPLSIAQRVIGLGFCRIIVLDVRAVGTNSGPTVVELCRQIHLTAPGVELIAGGGVRGITDLARLRAAGCSAALVASWLHARRSSSNTFSTADG